MQKKEHPQQTRVEYEAARIREFGKDFHMARREARMTMEAVSLETGVSVPTISRFELGNFRSLKAETYLALKAFADVFLPMLDGD